MKTENEILTRAYAYLELAEEETNMAKKHIKDEQLYDYFITYAQKYKDICNKRGNRKQICNKSI